MLCRTLGRTGLKVSIAGLGTGGASRLGHDTGRTRAESRRVVRKALDLGITETAAGDPRHGMLQTALREDLFDTFMVKYGILNQRAGEEIFPLARERNLGIFVMASVRTSLRTPQGGSRDYQPIH
ncbi:MAG: hypothetical protein U9R48_03520 [Chloroflexota bacterium]|nr:hypothetical protein [Chloroflexota bacterium]